MVCIICLTDDSPVKLSLNVRDSGALFQTEFCPQHADAVQAVLKRWMRETREIVVTGQSDKKGRWNDPKKDEEQQEPKKK